MIAVCDRDPSGLGCGDRRRHARYELELHTVLDEVLGLLGAAAKHHRIAALEPHDPASGFCVLDEQFVDSRLIELQLAGPTMGSAHTLEHLDVAATMDQHCGVDQVVDDHDIGARESVASGEGQQLGIPRPGANQGDEALGHRRESSRTPRYGPSRRSTLISAAEISWTSRSTAIELRECCGHHRRLECSRRSARLISARSSPRSTISSTIASLEARVEHEFRLIRELEVDHVVRALALERAGTKIVVVLDWCAGVNLDEFAGGKPIPLDLFLNIALQLSRVLADVHAQRVIHRDIKPTNILIDPATQMVSLADFGISVLLESERERINDPSVVAGTLPYVSPEQTGRTHREVDFRSDLYSLGVTFYELLTGRRPFSGNSPLELIHAHLARRPDPPQWLRPDIPTPLSAIVMKLLEKAPERRYQSARGLRLDLERLSAALREGRGLDQFELGQHDVPMTLQLPHRLYGRGVETELLAREFKRASKGEPRFVLITGPAGIGKSALIEQLAEPVMSRQGFLARGRFARDRSDKPYSGFTIAFEDLVEQLLTETDEQLVFWRREFEQTLGPLLSAACELVPKLSAIVGSTPSAVEFGPTEAHHRTALACVRFVAVFARVEHSARAGARRHSLCGSGQL